MVGPQVFKEYKTTAAGLICYVAGLPKFPRNFSRDVFMAGIIAQSRSLLRSQLIFSAAQQGKQYDPFTGEEPGKIHHEYPGVMHRSPYLTTYNACDTTAWFLIAMEALSQISPLAYDDLLPQLRPHLEAAVQYIVRHTHGHIFWEYPPAGTAHFSLRVTYWKDSIRPDVHGRAESQYPVAYALVHFQAARGLLSAARILHRSNLRHIADAMFRAGVEKFISPHAFCVSEDTSRLHMISSDELHSLAYIPVEYRQSLPLTAIIKRARVLLSSAGIACTPANIAVGLADKYHGYTVWPGEQALIHYGCQKFGLRELAAEAEQCTPLIDKGWERFRLAPKLLPTGNPRQLVSVAAGYYFTDEASLRHATWL